MTLPLYTWILLLQRVAIVCLKAVEDGNLPEIIVAGNDSVALGIMRGAFEANLRIPDDISIIGINDIPTARYAIPLFRQ